jgi:hypothetical protein
MPTVTHAPAISPSPSSAPGLPVPGLGIILQLMVFVADLMRMLESVAGDSMGPCLGRVAGLDRLLAELQAIADRLAHPAHPAHPDDANSGFSDSDSDFEFAEDWPEFLGPLPIPGIAPAFLPAIRAIRAIPIIRVRGPTPPRRFEQTGQTASHAHFVAIS